MARERDTRTRILDAALALFYEQGYHATTTKAIAVRAEINEVTLFRNFGSKENVFHAVIEREADITYELEEFDIVPSEDLVQDLTDVGVHMAQNMGARAKLMKIIMMEAGKDPGVWAHVSSTPFAVLERISIYFQQARDRGLIRDLDPYLISVAFFSFFFRSLVANAFLGRDVFVEMDRDNIGRFVEMFVNGIAVKE